MGKDWTVPFNITEVISDGNIPDGLRELLGDYVDDIVTAKPPEEEPDITETKVSKITEFTYQLPPSLSTTYCVKLASAIHDAKSTDGAILNLEGAGASAIVKAAFAGKPPRINPSLFVQYMGEHFNE